jgi:hypothetical protein
MLNVCCGIVGMFPAYAAGVFHSFNTVTQAGRRSDRFPHIKSNFTKKRGPHISFRFESFKFTLRAIGVSFIEYTVNYKDTTFPLLVLLIDPL